MGRKKRKVVDEDGGITASSSEQDTGDNNGAAAVSASSLPSASAAAVKQEEDKNGKQAPASSGYAMTSHSGVIVEADIYVSDGSEDEEDDVDVVLAHSRTGLMRRGLLPSAAAAPMHHRQWVREDAEAATEAEEEDLSQLDPVQRAARLQAEKLRQEQLEKQEALLQESQQNAGRDPTLFSKRTAFDIRFDQMEDKPWTRATDLSDFFNYGLSEEDWLEYAEQQMTIRQELIDAARAKRAPDPNIVPVTPKVPQSQQPRVAVSGGIADGDKSDDAEAEAAEDTNEPMAPLGPSLPAKIPATATTVEKVTVAEQIPEGVGGAWGAGAAPGSHLAKLIEEQERAQTDTTAAAPLPPPPPPTQSYYNNGGYENNIMDDGASQAGSSTYGSVHGRDDYRPRRGGRGRGRGRGRGGWGGGGYGGGGGGGYGGGGYAGGGDDYYNRKRPRDDWRR